MKVELKQYLQDENQGENNFTKRLKKSVNPVVAAALISGSGSVAFLKHPSFSPAGIPAYAAEVENNNALILEPFDGYPGLGHNLGQQEQASLQSMGMQPTLLTDEKASISAMEHMGNYSFVIDETHGAATDGEAIVTANDQNVQDAEHTQLFQDQSLKQVTIPGEGAELYDAATSTFFAKHVNWVSKNAIVFFNACSLKNATKLWDVLQTLGVSVLIGWDGEVQSDIANDTSQDLVKYVTEGNNIATAIEKTKQDGLGKDLKDNTEIGWVGDGNQTLSAAIKGSVPQHISLRKEMKNIHKYFRP